jgi:acetyltransferase-like isoleucine patch superfamily enzyme
MKPYKLRMRLRRAWWRLNAMAIEVGPRTRLDPTAQLRLQDGGSISIGRNCRIHRGVVIDTHGGNVVIGDNVSLNPYTVIYANGGVEIGADCRIAAHSAIIASNHGFEDRDVAIRHQPMTREGIVFEEDVWLGAGCRVVDGCRLGRGSIVGAGAVVTSNTDPFGIYVGVPARKIRERGQGPAH